MILCFSVCAESDSPGKTVKTIRYILFCLFSVLLEDTEISNMQGFIGIVTLATVLSVFCVSCFLMDKVFMTDRHFVVRILCGFAATVFFIGIAFVILYMTEVLIGS